MSDDRLKILIVIFIEFDVQLGGGGTRESTHCHDQLHRDSQDYFLGRSYWHIPVNTLLKSLLQNTFK